VNLPCNPQSLLFGAVLAGGQSTRLGRPKWRESVGGMPMAVRAAVALAPLARSVAVVSSDPAVGELGLPLLADAPGGAGPAAGLVAALEYARDRGLTGVLVLACDLPLVDEGMIGALVEAWTDEDVLAVEADGRMQPLCAIWSVAALPAAAAALRSSDRSLSRLARSLRLRTLGPAAWAGRSKAADPLLNVNEESDLARARELLDR